jgi:hypothetical protein
VTQAEIKVVIEQHARNVNGNPHRFRVAWIALEPRGSRARYLLSIDVCPERPRTGLWATVQVLTSVRTTREQLLSLVDDALDDFLREHGFDASTPVDPRVGEGDRSNAHAPELVPTATAGSHR